MLCPREEEDWVEGEGSKLASKFGRGGSVTFPDGLPDDCARELTPMPVHSREGMVSLG